MSSPAGSVTLRSVTPLAERIKAFEFVPSDGSKPDAHSPGAHIDLHLPTGLVRSYSLMDASLEGAYVVAIAHDPASRGGSSYLHEQASIDDDFAISGPRNNFPLHETADHSVFIAGGIGITPIYSMIRRLETLGRPWELYYSARTRRGAALVDEIHAMSGAATIRFDDECAGVPFDLETLLGQADAGAHLYCCGPIPMLDAFQKATAQRNPDFVHLERFDADQAAGGGFEVILKRSRRTLTIGENESILERLLHEGFDIPFSCQEGTCGDCETPVIAGTPDHRDVVLSRRQRQSNKVMMICCSGALTNSLTLDL